jgi:hypothetical protein
VNLIQDLRDLDGVAVEFSKIAPGGFVVVDIDGTEQLISRQRWEALPVWGSQKTPRRTFSGPSHSALVIALVGLLIALCESLAWLIGRALSAGAAVNRMMQRKVQHWICIAALVDHTDLISSL